MSSHATDLSVYAKSSSSTSPLLYVDCVSRDLQSTAVCSHGFDSPLPAHVVHVSVAGGGSCGQIFIIFTKEVIFLLVCLIVCLLAGLRKNYSNDFHKILWIGGTWALDETFRFWW